MIKQKFASNLRKIRKSRKLMQEQLAELVGVDFRYISFLENAKSFPSCELIEKFSEALHVNYSDLFSTEDELSKKELESRLIDIIKLLNQKDLNTLYKIAKYII